MLDTPNAQYNLATPDSMAVRVAGYQRRRMFDRFMGDARPGEDDTVLDIGATSDRSYSSSNYFEKWYPHKHRITAVGIDDAGFLEDQYPGMRFVQADGRALPFADDSFDFVHSSAVIEHVGAHAEQVRFLAECARVARRGIFITTPNRWFPVEFHTVTPLLHWLPPKMFRLIMTTMGKGFFADEGNLNLMTPRELAKCSEEAGADAKFSATVTNVKLGGWPSNLLLIAHKKFNA
jgi:ubiquinone/menaquinone biosynthesis C-methylase UbiE